MRIEIYGQQLDVTPALREYVETKFGRLQRHFEQPFEVRVQLGLDKPDHRAEANIVCAGRTFHADAAAPDMYSAIDLLVDKLDRLLLKHKGKQVDQSRRAESLSRIGETG